MNGWLAAGYTAFFLVLGGYLIRLRLLERRVARERERLEAGAEGEAAP